MYAIVLNYLEHGVSILVLMELPLQRVLKLTTNNKSISFNPCFNGTTSATDRNIEVVYAKVAFQSLF